jgi:hypothetical protein
MLHTDIALNAFRARDLQQFEFHSAIADGWLALADDRKSSAGSLRSRWNVAVTRLLLANGETGLAERYLDRINERIPNDPAILLVYGTVKETQAGRLRVQWPNGRADDARQSDAVVYGITVPAPGGAITPSDDLEKRLRSEPRLYRGALLPVLARETGGESLRATDAQNLSAVFVDAVSRFNTRYVLSYAPTGVPASGWHPIEVRVSASGVDVRTRRGYVR